MDGTPFILAIDNVRHGHFTSSVIYSYNTSLLKVHNLENSLIYQQHLFITCLLWSFWEEPPVNCSSPSSDRHQFNHMPSVQFLVLHYSRPRPRSQRDSGLEPNKNYKKAPGPEAKTCLRSAASSRFVTPHLFSCVLALFLWFLKILGSGTCPLSFEYMFYPSFCFVPCFEYPTSS